IPGELARAVPGDPAAAVAVDHRGAGSVGRTRRAFPILGPLAGRVDGVVLGPQHRVGHLAGEALRVQPPLPVPRRRVVDTAGANDLDHASEGTPRLAGAPVDGERATGANSAAMSGVDQPRVDKPAVDGPAVDEPGALLLSDVLARRRLLAPAEVVTLVVPLALDVAGLHDA